MERLGSPRASPAACLVQTLEGQQRLVVAGVAREDALDAVRAERGGRELKPVLIMGAAWIAACRLQSAHSAAAAPAASRGRPRPFGFAAEAGSGAVVRRD
jgi:hypothetical protein